jgi:nifR3 family TIM-barrel protein
VELVNSGFRIGSLELADKLLLAPMAGITNLPVRLLARRQGAALCYTEMVSVNGLIRDGAKSFALMKSSPEDRPLAVQLFGDDPEILARGAELSVGYADLIDINMGCPVKKVVAGGAGSALLQEPERVRGIIRAVRRVTRLPLTVKIRSGWGADSINYLLVAKIAEDEGVDAVTLHPRTRAQMFEGHSDWQQIAALKQALAIPVIGSGDLFTAADIVAMFSETGCDAVMAARGALGNPWLFRSARALLAGLQPPEVTMAERRDVALSHLQLLIADVGAAVAVKEMRKNLCWYAKGVAGAAHFRGEVNRIDSMEEMERAINTFFSRQTDES